MGSVSNEIVNCLFFGTESEDAANFYVSIFPNSKIKAIARFPDLGDGNPNPSHKPGSVLTVNFTLNGKEFTALNSKPSSIQFNESVSFQIMCDTQEEVDHYWDKLSEGGDPKTQMCGWLKDKFGVSWQVVPKLLPEIFSTGDPEKSARSMKAFSAMKKINIQAVRDAAEGKGS
ncbi:hypothetical protein LTR84_011769 [Exophiala bonariae]|uniref:PhnB-like domain-containing protein n=1 Tax=Exophiala bonariae TaxID=1690606 RepID=A0AAV9NJE9_9EURO|nr:hypothetical protein LTR84_011769 [Exophiala bonariae]